MTGAPVTMRLCRASVPRHLPLSWSHVGNSTATVKFEQPMNQTKLMASEHKENSSPLFQLAGQRKEGDPLPLEPGVNFFPFDCCRYAKFSSFILAAAGFLVVTGSQRWAGS